MISLYKLSIDLWKSANVGNH